VNELSSHFMRVFARPDVLGLFISTSAFASRSFAARLSPFEQQSLADLERAKA
jgi:hypothetical protein